MKYKVKVTVLDKNCTRNYKSSIVLILLPELVLVIMWVTSLSFIVMMNGMTSGTWD